MEDKPTWPELIAEGHTVFAVYCHNERHIPSAQRHVDNHKKYGMKVDIVPLAPPGTNGERDSKGRVIINFRPDPKVSVHAVGEYA